MKHFLHFLGTIILTAIISLIVAVLFGLLHYLGYLLSWVEKPSIMNILGMALILWTIMLLHGLISVVVTKGFDGAMSVVIVSQKLVKQCI